MVVTPKVLSVVYHITAGRFLDADMYCNDYSDVLPCCAATQTGIRYCSHLQLKFIVIKFRRRSPVCQPVHACCLAVLFYEGD